MGAVTVGWYASIALHPGCPDPPVLAAAFERMLSHRDPVVEFTSIEWTGAAVPTERPAESVVEAWFIAGCPTGFGVTLRGRGNSLTLLAEDRAGDRQGALIIHWGFEPKLCAGLVDLVVDLAVVLASPLAVLSHAAGGRAGRAGWRSRVGLHVAASNAVVGRPYGLLRGLPGVAHRTVLGDELVAMFGEDRLAALPPELAHRRNGRWVLTPTDDPLEWTYDRWCPGEAAIIEALGTEHFFDPSTGALPSVVPDLPEVAPYRCRTRDPATGTWIEHNA